MVLAPCRSRQARSSRLSLTERSDKRQEERAVSKRQREGERCQRHVASDLAMMLFIHPPQSAADSWRSEHNRGVNAEYRSWDEGAAAKYPRAGKRRGASRGMIQDWWMWDPVWQRLYAWVRWACMSDMRETEIQRDRKKVTQDRQKRDEGNGEKERDWEKRQNKCVSLGVTEQSRCIKGNAPPSFLYTHTHLPLHCQHSSKHAFSEQEWAVNGKREGWADRNASEKHVCLFEIQWQDTPFWSLLWFPRQLARAQIEILQTQKPP